MNEDLAFWLKATTIALLATFAIALAENCEAAEYNYRVTWDDNPPADEVVRYEIVANSSTGNQHVAEVTGNPPKSELIMSIDEPTGTVLSFTAQAFSATEESGLSDPVTITHPAPVPGMPTGLQVIQIDVTVKVTQ
jgi:hypothetical protein